MMNLILKIHFAFLVFPYKLLYNFFGNKYLKKGSIMIMMKICQKNFAQWKKCWFFFQFLNKKRVGFSKYFINFRGLKTSIFSKIVFRGKIKFANRKLLYSFLIKCTIFILYRYRNLQVFFRKMFSFYQFKNYLWRKSMTAKTNRGAEKISKNFPLLRLLKEIKPNFFFFVPHNLPSFFNSPYLGYNWFN